MAKCQKRYLVLVMKVVGNVVNIASGVWMVFGRKTQIYEDITWAELEPGDGKYDWEKIRLYIFKCNLIFFANYWTK